MHYYAKTPDLIVHLENTSGMNLTNFFNQWYYNQGYPTFQVQWFRTGNNLVVKIDQTQSHAFVTFIEMPVQVRFQVAGFDTALIFNHSFSCEVFNATINFTATSVRFDPELWILSKNNNGVQIDAVGNRSCIDEQFPHLSKPGL